MFKPIPAGLFSAMSVNKRLRALYERIEALEAQASPVSSATVDSAETVVVEAPTAAEEGFDWRTSHDIKALKEWAKDVHDMEIKGNKKAETIRAEIAEFLAEE